MSMLALSAGNNVITKAVRRPGADLRGFKESGWSVSRQGQISDGVWLRGALSKSPAVS